MSDIVGKLKSLSLTAKGKSSKIPLFKGASSSGPSLKGSSCNGASSQAVSSSKGVSSRGTNFFSLPGELRNQIYHYYAIGLQPNRRFTSANDMYWGFDIRRHHDHNALNPKIPALMQTSTQVRSEFSTFYNRTFDLKCDDYPSFRVWSQGIGASIVCNLGELHLTIKINVNLVDKDSSSKRREHAKLTPANLRVRFNSARDLGIEHEGPAVRFWFDMVDDPYPDSLKPDFDRMNYNDDSSLWTFTPSCVERLSREFESRLRWDRQINAADVLGLVEWLSGDGVISFHGPSKQPVKNKNTFKIKEEGARRYLMAMQYPPGSCEYCTVAAILWDKPIQTPGVAGVRDS